MSKNKLRVVGLKPARLKVVVTVDEPLGNFAPATLPRVNHYEAPTLSATYVSNACSVRTVVLNPLKT